MNSFVAVAIVTLFFIGSAWHLTYLLNPITRVERIGLALLLGSGLTTLIWFSLYRLGLPFNTLTFLISGTTVATIGYLLTKTLHLSPSRFIVPGLDKLEKWLAVLVMILLVSSFVIGSYSPLTAWDSLALYDFRGHAIAINHDLTDLTGISYYVSYPLMISLIHASIYMLGGVSAQGIHALIFAAFIAIAYGRMRDWTNIRYALLTCLLIITNYEIYTHSTFAYTNLPYTAYLISAVLYCASLFKHKTSANHSLIITGLLIGLSTWMRSLEVFWFIGLILIIWQGYRNHKVKYAIIGVSLAIIFRTLWTSFYQAALAAMNYERDPVSSSLSLKTILTIFEDQQAIFTYLYINVYLPYIGYWLLVIPSIVIMVIKRSSRLVLLNGFIMLSIGTVIAGVMVISTYFSFWDQIGDSARRMVLFIIPLSLTTAMYALYTITHPQSHE